jgi:hypothetical protein
MSYTSHFIFAAGVSAQLFIRSVLLLVHSFLPWLEFSKFDIESTISYLKDKHNE